MGSRHQGGRSGNDPSGPPAEAKATLGQVLADLKDNPDARTVLLATSSTTLGQVESLEAMMRLIWPKPDRHAGGNKRAPTLDEAEAVVHLAVALVQWMRLRVVT